jgi:hypothetical protein
MKLKPPATMNYRGACASPPTEEDIMSDELTRKGPAIGARFPDITLPDQTGAPVRLQEARRDRRALVVFYRSARW